MLGSTIRSALVLAVLVALVVGCAFTPNAPPATTPVASLPTGTSTTGSISRLDPAAGANYTGTVTLVVVPEKSQARYRVREQLVGLSLPDDAVGTTNSFTGTIVGKTDGTIVSSASQFVVDLRTLRSDQSQRDNFIQRTPLQTNQYPYATFVPTSVVGLSTSLPSLGQGVSNSFKLIGDLTLRNVTKQVTWDATCKVPSDLAEGTCQATTNFTFGYFNLNQPQVGRVLSIVDNIILEVDVDLARVSP